MLPKEPDALAPTNVAAAWASVKELTAAVGRKADLSKISDGADDVVEEVACSASVASASKARKISARSAFVALPQQGRVVRRRGSDEVDDEDFLLAVLECSNCSDLFPTRHELLLHRLQWHPLQPHQCPECMAAFAQAALLDQHHLTHTGEQPHPCLHPGCLRRFSLKGHVKSHTRAVHAVQAQPAQPSARQTGPEFKCGTCAKAFQTAAALANHQRCHSDERPFACDECSSTFKLRSNLVRHTKKSHPQ